MNQQQRPDALEEWKFEFGLYATRPKQVVIRHKAEELLVDVITAWAEENDFGVGGGFAPYGPEVATVWKFEFGLCATLPEQVVSRQEAEEVLDVIKRWAAENRFGIRGGFRPFEPEDLEPFPIK